MDFKVYQIYFKLEKDSFPDRGQDSEKEGPGKIDEGIEGGEKGVQGKGREAVSDGEYGRCRGWPENTHRREKEQK